MGIDEKFVTAISLLDEADSSELESGGKVNFGRHAREINMFREGLQYLTDRAQIQTIAGIISQNTSLKEELEALKAELLKQIEAKTEEIRNYPKITIVRPKKGLIGEFRALEQSLCKKKNDTLRAKRAEAIGKKREELAALRKRLSDLKALEKSVSTPKSTITTYLQKECKNAQFSYDSLLEHCYKALSEGIITNNYMIDSGIFYKRENGELAIDPKKAKSFISMTRNEKSIVKLASFLRAKRDVREHRLTYRKNLAAVTSTQRFRELAHTEEMAIINDKINEIAESYRILHEMENKARRGNIFNRTVNFVRARLGMETGIRIPDKVYAQREKVSDLVSEFVKTVETNKKLQEAFAFYHGVRKEMNYGRFFDLRELKDIASTIITYGDRVELFESTTTIEQMDGHAMVMIKRHKDNMEREHSQLEESKKAKENAYNALSKRDLQILERIGEDGVDFISGMFFPDQTGVITKGKKREKLVPSTAIAILEGLIGKGTTDIAKAMDSYGKVFGEQKRDERIAGMNEQVYNIISAIKQKAKEIATVEVEQPASFTPERIEVQELEEI